MNIKVKRGLLLTSVLVITIVCYLIMNRNYDPLSRYPYDIDNNTRETILNNLNELEIKYIIDYSIEPSDFMFYINEPNFNVYFVSEYNEADKRLYFLTASQVVKVVNKIQSKNLDFEECMSKYEYIFYDSIMEDLD